MGEVKTSIVLPSDLYTELKRRAVGEGKTLKEVIIEAILNYLACKGSKSKVKELILRASEGAGPEDIEEYGGEDIGV